MEAIIKTIILSILPVSELRGGIPYAIYSGMNPFAAFWISVLANIVVVPIVFLFLDYLHCYLLKIRFYEKTFNSFLERTRKRTHRLVERYGYFGLAIFVAIPFPITGAWTGTFAAWFFGMKRKKSFLAIALGVIIAGIIVTTVSYFGINALRLFVA